MNARSNPDRHPDLAPPQAPKRDPHAEVLDALEKAIAATRPLAGAPALASERTESGSLESGAPDHPQGDGPPPADGDIGRSQESAPPQERPVVRPVEWDVDRAAGRGGAAADRLPPRSPYAPRPPRERARPDRIAAVVPLDDRQPVVRPVPARPRRAAAEPDWSMRSLLEPPRDERAPQPVDLDDPQRRDDVLVLLKRRQGALSPAEDFEPLREFSPRPRRRVRSPLFGAFLAAAAAAVGAYVLIQLVMADPALRQSSSGAPDQAARLAAAPAEIGSGGATADNVGAQQPEPEAGAADPIVPRPVKTTAVPADGADALPRMEPLTTGAASAAPGDAQREPAAARRLEREEILNLVTRGVDALHRRDVASARLLLRRAAEAGDAHAAMVLGASYDPAVIEELGALGAVADVAEARAWYLKASELGSTEAGKRLQLLAERAQ